MYNYIKRVLVLAEGEVEGMKKRYLLIACVLLSMLLTSCQGGTILKSLDFFSPEDKDTILAEKCMNTLCARVKKRDTAAVKGMFSKKACADAGDIEAQIEELFVFIEGDVLSCKRDENTPVVADEVEYGKASKCEWIWFTLVTSKDTYYIFLSYYPVETINPENKGIYALLALRACDEDGLDGSMNEWSELPGINIQRFQDETQESTRTAVPLGG